MEAKMKDSTPTADAHLLRWMNQKQAAQYLSLSRSTFRRKVDEGKLPAGKYITEGRLIWDRLALDKVAEASPEA